MLKSLVKYTKPKPPKTDAKERFDDMCRRFHPTIQVGDGLVVMQGNFDKSEISFRSSPPKLVAYFTGTFHMKRGKIVRTVRYRYEKGRFVFEHAFPFRVTQ